MPFSRPYCQGVVWILGRLPKPRTTCGGDCNRGKARPIRQGYWQLAEGSEINSWCVCAFVVPPAGYAFLCR